MSSKRLKPGVRFAVLLTAFCCVAAVTFASPSAEALSVAHFGPVGSAQSGDGTSGSSTQSGSTKAAEDKVDVLTATRDEIRDQMATLDSQYEAQKAAVTAAQSEVSRAREAVDAAKARVAAAEAEVDQAEKAVRQYALEAYTQPPAIESISALSMEDTNEASYVSDVLSIVTAERRKVVDVLAVKRRIAAMESDRADEAATVAQEKAAAAQNKLEQLEHTRNEQADLSAGIDERLENALAEVAALREIDEKAADRLEAQETELRRSVPRTVSTTTPTKVAVASSQASPQSTAGTHATQPSKSTNTTRPRSTTTTTAPKPPSGMVTWADVTSVGGIWINKSIASNLRGLLNAATSAGFSLSGGGYRDSQSQINTRRQNCGPTYYDIYVKPSGQCSPPTAIPGRSMHEQGKAVDFQSNGALITSRSNPAFIWLSNNASRFGFYNLPSEPWHWSTNGH